MKKIVLIIPVMLLLFTAILSISKAANVTGKTEITHNDDTIFQKLPKIEYHANSYYDENGNLIGYDSIYIYSFSGSDLSSEKMEEIFRQYDKLMHGFGGFTFNYIPFGFNYNEQQPGDWQKKQPDDIEYHGSPFNGYFFDFGNDINELMQRMDSIRNDMLNQQLREQQNNKINSEKRYNKTYRI